MVTSLAYTDFEFGVKRCRHHLIDPVVILFQPQVSRHIVLAALVSGLASMAPDN